MGGELGLLCLADNWGLGGSAYAEINPFQNPVFTSSFFILRGTIIFMGLLDNKKCSTSKQMSKHHKPQQHVTLTPVTPVFHQIKII